MRRRGHPWLFIAAACVLGGALMVGDVPMALAAGCAMWWLLVR